MVSQSILIPAHIPLARGILGGLVFLAGASCGNSSGNGPTASMAGTPGAAAHGGSQPEQSGGRSDGRGSTASFGGQSGSSNSGAGVSAGGVWTMPSSSGGSATGGARMRPEDTASGGSSASTSAGSAGDAASSAGNGDGNAGTASGGGANAGTCAGTAMAAPGDTTESVTVGGATRTYIRHIPSGYTNKTPVPVVIDFHPLGGTGASWKGSTGWRELADKKGFIMIWPDGYQNSWNAGRCCRAAMEEKIDDVGFTKAIIAALQKAACIDAKRVYATGCSNGGGMAFKVACDAADVIAAVAPVDFDCVTNSASQPSCGLCAPARPISEIQFRGTADSAVPYEGGMHSGGVTEHPGAQQNFTDWAQINACTGTAQALADHSGCQVYPMCADGAETTLCTVQNGTHCGNYQSFGIVDVAWQMFERHALP